MVGVRGVWACGMFLFFCVFETGDVFKWQKGREALKQEIREGMWWVRGWNVVACPFFFTTGGLGVLYVAGPLFSQCPFSFVGESLKRAWHGVGCTRGCFGR